ncbi:unnamed protein product [Schistosoma spindalis]|nr:unnamed protein product [Schistosoma spindale]
MRNRGSLRFIFIFLFYIFICKSTCNIFDVCSTNPCHSNGYCISYENGGFHCRCSQGWTGEDCSVDVDECHLSSTNPCEHNGVCINSPGGYQCLCPPGYHGSRCEDEILECALNPCKHDGTCIDLINGFQCVCPLGYEGLTCEDEINECSSSPCKNGAQCEDLINNYTCHCLPGWTGLHCENRIKPCAANSSLCLNNATCLDLMTTNESIEMINESNDLFVCLCPEGFHGKLCETKIINNYCTEIVCQNGGQCNILDNGKEYCTCLKNYHGLYCEVEESQEEQNTQLFRTEKDRNEMETFNCFKTPCFNNGTCHVLGGISNSSTITIATTTIDNNNNNGSTFCHCKPGFSGHYCENIQDYCQHSPCKNGGVCMLQNGSNNNNTINHLNVVTAESNYTCMCQPGYSGKHCEINIFDCFNQPCGFYGICKDEINGYHCECLKGWEGLHCDKKSLSAKLITYEKNTGSNSMLMLTNSNSQKFHFNHSRLCPKNYYCANSALCIFTNDDTSSFMLNNTKQFDNLNITSEYKCLCETAIGRFEGNYCDIDVNECFESEEKQSSLCQNGGQCINTYGSYICSCTTDYYGKNCEYSFNPCNLDNASTCFNGGICLPSSDGAGTLCVCPKGFTGPQCREQINECTGQHSCMNDGICLDLIGKYHCLCPIGRYGMNCESTSKQICTNQLCSENVNVRNCTTDLCLNGGSCINFHTTDNGSVQRDNHHKYFRILEQNNLLESQLPHCSCPFGYIGEYCQIELDFCQLFHHIKHYFSNYFKQPKEIEDYFLKNLTISSYLINDWLISSSLTSLYRSWYEINLLYATFVINYTYSRLLNDTSIRNILSTGNLFINNSLVDKKSTLSNSTLYMITSPMGLCDPIGSSQCVPLLSFVGNGLRSDSGGFTCICHVDYGGRYCEKYVDFCDKMNKQYNGNYCLNGGWCENQIKQITSNYNGYCGLNCDKYGTECFVFTNKSSSIVNEITTDLPIATTVFTTTTTISSTNIVTSNDIKKHKTMSNVTLWPGEETELSYCVRENCQLKKHNGRCDRECDLIACDFDHGDCLYALSVPLNPLSYIEPLESSDISNHNDNNTSHYVSFVQDIQQHPEPAIPWRSCSVLIEHIEHTPCHLLFGDGNCDPQCFREECLFDGWDCTQTKFDVNFTKENCSESSCQDYYITKTMECNQNDEDNCTLSDDLKNITFSTDLPIISDNNNNIMNMSSGTKHYTSHIVPGSLVLLINSTPEELITMHSEKLSLLTLLNTILHLEVEIEHHPKTGNLMIYPVVYITNYTNDNYENSLFRTIQLKNSNLLTSEQVNIKSAGIRSRYSRHVNMKSSMSGKQLLFDQNEKNKKIYQKESMGSQVYLQLNSKKCDETGGPCFHNVDFAAQFLTAYMHTRNHNLLQTILTVQSIRPDTSSTSLFEGEKRSRYKIMDLSIYITSLLICILFLIFLFGVLFTVNHFQRQRANYHLRSTGSFHASGRLGQKMIKKVLKAKIWYPSPGLVRNSRIVHNSPNNYNKPSKFTDDPTKYLSLKLPTLEQQSITTTTTTTSYDEQINDVNIKNKSVSELEKCLDMLQGKAYDAMTIDNKNSTSLIPASPTSHNQHDVNKTFSDFGDMNTKFTPNHIPSTLIKHTTTHTFAMPISCISQNYLCNLSSLSSTEHQQNQLQHYSFMPMLESTEYGDSGSSSNSTMTTAINMNRTNNFSDFDCQQSENSNSFNNNSNNFQTMQELCQFLSSITQSELNSFQKILQKTILDYYGSGELLEMNSYERYQQKQHQQRLCTTFARLQNPALNSEINNSDFNIVCHLLTQNDEPNTMQTMLHSSVNSMISWQMIYNSTHLHRLLNLRIPDTGETLLHISARFNQDKAIYNLLNAGADFSTVDNQGRTALYTAVSVSAIESVQAILNHPTSGLSPFCYLPNTLQDSTTPLIQAIKLGDTDIFNMLLHAMNVLVCALTKTNISRGQEYTSYDIIGTSTDLIHIQSTSSSLSTGAVASSSSPPAAIATPTFNGGVEFNYEENTLNFLDINTSDSLGRTALHWAAVTDQSDVIHSLCNSGATVDAQTLHEETPLALACREGAMKSCRLLLLTGANSNLADYLDRTPRDLAYLGGHYEIVNLLDEYTANSNTEYCTSGNLNKLTRKHDLFTSKTLTTETTDINTLSTLSRVTSMEQSYCSYFPTSKLYNNNSQHQLTYDTESITHKLPTGNPASQHYSVMKSAVKNMNEKKCPKNRSVHCIMTTTTTTVSTIGVTTMTTAPTFIETYGLTTTVATSSSLMFNNKYDSFSASQYSLVSESTTKLITTNDTTTTNNNNGNNTNSKRTPPSLALLNTNTNNNDNNDNTVLNSIQTFNKPDNFESFTNNTNNNNSSNDVQVEILKDSLLKIDYNFNNNNNNNTHINHIITNSNIMGSDESESPNHWSSSSSDLSPNRTNINNIILQKFDEQPSIIRGIHHQLNTSNLSSIMLSKWKSCINVNNYPHYNRVITNCSFTNPNIINTTYNKESFLTNYNNQYHFNDYDNNHHQQQYQRQYNSTDRQ